MPLWLALASCAILGGWLVLSGARALAAGSGPAITNVSATNITEHGATLEAQINPEGIATVYEFWVESAVCKGGSPTCEKSGHPREEEQGYIVAGCGGKTVVDDVTGLLSNTYSWYWVVAVSAGGTAESHHNLFEAGAPPEACPEGCYIVEVTPPSKSLQGILEASKQYGEEAPAREAARQQAAKEQAEREAKQAHEREQQELDAREAPVKLVLAREEREAAEAQAAESGFVECVIPSLKGDTLGRAQRLLSRAHCRLGEVSRPKGHHGRLVVTQQRVSAGGKLPSGTRVGVTLGRAPLARR